MTWKLPLNLVGSGRTFSLGVSVDSRNQRESELSLEQHRWLEDILQEIGCLPSQQSADLEPFSLELKVEKQSDCYRVRVALKMVPRLECVRSLTEFRHPVEVETEALYVRASDTHRVNEHELSDGEMEAYEHDGSCLILSEFVTDVIYTSLPDFPLCQTDCKGLCSECGCNLNVTKCCAASDATRAASEFHCPSLKYFN